MRYLNVKKYSAKIGVANESSIGLFTKLGFKEVLYVYMYMYMYEYVSVNCLKYRKTVSALFIPQQFRMVWVL